MEKIPRIIERTLMKSRQEDKEATRTLHFVVCKYMNKLLNNSEQVLCPLSGLNLIHK